MGITHQALNVIDYSTLTVGTSTALTLASASPAMDVTKGTVGGRRVRRAHFSVEEKACRWRGDGSAPTNSEGHRLEPGDILTLTEANYEELLKAIQFLSLESNCIIKITFFD